MSRPEFGLHSGFKTLIGLDWCGCTYEKLGFAVRIRRPVGLIRLTLVGNGADTVGGGVMSWLSTGNWYKMASDLSTPKLLQNGVEIGADFGENGVQMSVMAPNRCASERADVRPCWIA